MRRRAVAAAGAAFAMTIGIVPAPAAERLVGYATVYDGDRIDVQGKRIRLADVDAPERAQTCADADEHLFACGRHAEVSLQEKIAGKPVTCEPVPSDQSFPRVALCRLGEEDLGAWLVEQGLAVVDRLHPTTYSAQEAAARQAKRGIWAGTFTRPWDWREGARGRPDGYAMPVGGAAAASATTAEKREDGCRIKGNITREGTKLYWVPGSRRYAETVIAEASGERWFCTEDEAKAAGWLEPQALPPP